MAWLSAGARRFDVDLVIFDKDGTIVDFDLLWAGKMRRAVDDVVQEARLDARNAARLMKLIGVDPVTLKVVPESPLAVTTLPKIGVVCTVGLFQSGMAWHAAEALVQRSFLPAIEAPPAPQDLRPLGDLLGILSALDRSGIRSAILTSDDRLATVASLPMLGIGHFIAAMVCGDDPYASKPSPDGLEHIAKLLAVNPDRILMIGDSAADMKAGRNAGVAGCIAVCSGTGRREDLAALADVVIETIDGLTVAS